MAKQQTFAEKAKKKKGDDFISVKVIKGYTSDIGSVRFIEKMVKITDIAQIEKIEIN